MFPKYIIAPLSISNVSRKEINHFELGNKNIDIKTVESFGDEWSKFDNFSNTEIEEIAKTHYFDIVKEEWIKDKVLLDVGCGTGRWTKYVANYAKSVDAIDPSIAINSAAKMLNGFSNVRLSQASVASLPFDDHTFDFIFSLGVLHHIPDTRLAVKQCVSKLKVGGYFLIYLYYNLENRGVVFKSIFKASNLLRKGISNMPASLKNLFCDVLAILIYLPLILISFIFKKVGLLNLAHKIPLHFYVGKSFYVIKNDARDRFGTPLEQRFSKKEITEMLTDAGLIDVIFSDNEPYWHAVARKEK